MKKIFVFLLAAMMLLASSAPAEDLSALSDEELTALQQQVLAEIERRESAADLPAFATINEALIAAGPVSLNSDNDAVVLGMEYMGKYIRVISMLDEHAKELRLAAPRADDFSGWDAFDQYAYELPVSCIEEFTEMPKDQAELDTLTGKTMTELLQEGYTPFGVWGEGEPRDRHIIALSFGLYSYSFEFDMTDEEYTKYMYEDIIGDWPVKSVQFDGFSNEALSVNYNPDGTPRTGTASLVKETAGSAGSASGLPAFPAISEAYGVSESATLLSRNPDFAVLALEYKGKYLRVVSALDDHGKELYKAAWGDGTGYDSDAVDEFYTYAESLPVSYVEEFATQPLTQEKLDALDGKTLRDLEKEGYTPCFFSSRDSRPYDYIGLDYGFYSYTFDVDETYSKYLETNDYNDMMNITVKNGRFSGFSSRSTDLSYSADETFAEGSGRP